jgi:hypothetical protein
MIKKIFAAVLLILSVAAAVAAIGTLIPSGGPLANDLGFHSMCPFAPWSTLILLAAGGVIWVVRQYLLTRVD